jgi:hypothetical protein
MAMPSLSHQTDSLERLKRALGLAKGTPVIRSGGRAELLESVLEHGEGKGFPGRVERLASVGKAFGALVGAALIEVIRIASACLVSTLSGRAPSPATLSCSRCRSTGYAIFRQSD